MKRVLRLKPGFSSLVLQERNSPLQARYLSTSSTSDQENAHHSLRWLAATTVAALGASAWLSSTCEEAAVPAQSTASSSGDAQSQEKVTRFMDWLKEQGADLGGVEVRMSQVGLPIRVQPCRLACTFKAYALHAMQTAFHAEIT